MLWIGFLLAVACAAGARGEVIRLDALRRSTERVVPFAIPEFKGGAAGSTIAGVVKSDLLRHGAFAQVPASAQELATLDAADRQGGIHFRNWANLGAQILGKGDMQAGDQVTVEFTLYTPHNAKRLFAKRYSASAGATRKIGHSIADDIIEAVLNEKSFFGSRLLFVKGNSQAKNIYVCDADGANQRALTSGSSLCLYPDWFPNRQEVLFTGYFEGRPIMYKMSATGGTPMRLLARPGMNISGCVSPNDQDGSPELYVISLSSGNRKRLTIGKAVESSPSWSPDSRQIVYTCGEESGSRPEIYIISASGGAPRKLTTTVFSSYCSTPAWSPDGKKIAFAAQLGGNFEICMYDFASRQIYQLTTDRSNDEQPSWAKDSRHIAFARVSGRASRVMLLDSETGKTSTLLQDAEFCGSPAWEP